MIERRNIREEERELIEYLISEAQVNRSFSINSKVYEYEGGVMGSISLGSDDAKYAKDLIQCKYIDVDNTAVIITLTLDEENNLLDLDFWKEDFSRLIKYPKPSLVEIILI